MKKLFTALLALVCVNVFAANVTFHVNMIGQTVSPNGVHVVGDFQNWDPAASPLTDNGDGTYSGSFEMTAGVHLFKYINGNDWSGEEAVPAACGVDNGFGGYNRSLLIETSVTLDLVCFEGCTDCLPVVDPFLVNVTFNVNMNHQAISANGVHLAGNFQSWDPAATEMTDADGDSIYSATVSILSSSSIEYKFVNGNAWGDDEAVPSFCATNNNRTATINLADTALAPICYAECADCTPIVVTPTNLITFLVDMHNQTVSPAGVHIAGNFNGYSPSSDELLDDNGDGVYSITLELDEWANLSFKFINGDTFAGQEIVPSSCGLPDGFGGYNRIVETGSIDVNFGPVCFGECSPCTIIVEPTMVDLTFLVNMNSQTVSPNGVHIAGSFQGWDPSSTEMIDSNADGIYEYTASVESGSDVQFKFINGDAWGNDETVPSSCGTGSPANRAVGVSSADATFGPVCFGACLDCNVQPTLIDATFFVDMNNEIVSANGVHIAGNFQTWDPATSEMTDADGNGVYEFTAQVEAGTNILFKYINGNAWGNSEIVPTECGLSDGFGAYNRQWQIGSTDESFGPVCFGACDICQPIIDPTTVEVAFRVNMSQETVSPDGVFVNFGAPDGMPMTLVGNGIYEYVGQFESNTQLLFFFQNGFDNEVIPAECGFDNGFGGMFRTITPTTPTSVFGPVCFGECIDCITVNPSTVNVTFEVNMINEVVSADGVHIAGNFQGWNPATTALTDIDGDGIYSITTEVDPNQTLLFKFINGIDWAGQETVTSACGESDGFGGFNRAFDVLENDSTFGPVCFSGCTNCGSINPILVVFQVDMTNEIVSPDGVFIAGTFNGWDNTVTQLANSGNNIYQAVVVLNPFDIVNYKFVNGTSWETVPSECGVGADLNREYTATEESMQTLPVVCFSSCSTCVVVPTSHLTLQVNMINETVSPDGVHVAGTFNDFAPNTIPMTLVSGSTYSVTINVPQNAIYQYKFINGNAWGTDEQVPFECGVDNGTGGYNRSVNVASSDVTMPTVCFNACTDCIVSVEEIAGTNVKIYPNPAKDRATIEMNAGIQTIQLFDALGQLVQTIGVNGRTRIDLDLSQLANGLYTAVGQGHGVLGQIMVQK